MAGMIDPNRLIIAVNDSFAIPFGMQT